MNLIHVLEDYTSKNYTQISQGPMVSITSNIALYGPQDKQELISQMFNTLRLRQNGRHFADDTFKCIFMNENVWITINISLKFFLNVELTIFQHWFR